jgi:hypothetical protein
MVIRSHNLSIKLNQSRSEALMVLKVNFIVFINVFRFSVESLSLDLENIDDS